MAWRTQDMRRVGVGLMGCALLGPAGVAAAQVFTVGQQSATAGVTDTFSVTQVALSSGRLGERGRRELERMLVAEQGFAHTPLPFGPGLTLQANGPTSPGGEHYRQLLFQKGQAAGIGDRVMITAVVIRGNRMVLDFNGGPYAKHRFLSHVQLNGGNVAAPQDEATGARITLVFPDGIPEVTAPDVKALLEPLVDFGVKSSEEAYADTLPQPLREAIAAHEVLVGMNRRMVLAALGQPGSKMRERGGADGQEAMYEEWIYGQVPETVKFVRFQGDRVSQVKVAEVGKPVLVRTQDEVNGFSAPPPRREVLLGDRPQASSDGSQTAATPTLRQPGEAAPPNASGPVQLPPSSSGAGGSASQH